MEIFSHELLHALKDTAFVFPVLYLAYLIVSYFSHNDNEKYAKILHKTRKAGPVIGAFLGCIPQCGFSALMSQLYSKKIITFGTLIAVFISTSDEAIPIMIAKPEFIPSMLIMIGIKFCYGLIVGYIIDGVYKLFSRRNKVLQVAKIDKKTKIKQNKTIDCSVNNDINVVSDEKQDEQSSINIEKEKNEEMDKAVIEFSECEDRNNKHKCHHHHDECHVGHSHCCATNIFLDALNHTLIIIGYVFAVTLIINLIKGYCGGLEPLQKFFTKNSYLQIALACLIGLIPNCASSVFLVELYMEGVLFFPALIAGLSAGAGVGLIVLYTANYKKPWINILITVFLYTVALILGIITSFIPFPLK